MGDAMITKGEFGVQKKVDLSGLEWLPLTATLGYPYEVAMANYQEMRIASVSEVEKLLQSLMLQEIDTLVAANFEGANWFLENFGVWDSEWNYGTQSTVDFYYNVDLNSKTVAKGTVTRQIYSEEGKQKYFDDFGHYPEDSGLIKYGLSEKIADETFQSYSAGFLLVKKGLSAPQGFTVSNS